MQGFRSYPGNPSEPLTRSACNKCRRSCPLMIISPVPTVNQITETSGLRNRIWFTSYSRARSITSRVALLLDKNLSKTEASTREPGTIFFGAGTFFWLADGSAKLLINHRPNQPGVISSTRFLDFPLNAPAIADRYTSFVIQRCSRHCPTLHPPSAGCQFNCSALSPPRNLPARSSAAANSETSRSAHIAIAHPPLGQFLMQPTNAPTQ